MKTKPLNNNVLIEVVRDYNDVSRVDENEILQQGILRDVSVSPYHLTASAGVEFNLEWSTGTHSKLMSLVGKTVRWEQYAEGGQTFVEDGKTYALIPFWRLISYESEES